MLKVYLKLDHATRPMQKRWEQIFRVRRESYRVVQKNALDRLLHAFPAMIAARWADASDYLSNRRADWDEMDAIIAYQAIRIVPVDTNGMRWYHGIPFFLSFFLLLPPYNPLLLSIYLSISLPWNRQAISCPHAEMVRQLRQLKMTTKCFGKVLSPYNPLSPKLYL